MGRGLKRWEEAEKKLNNGIEAKQIALPSVCAICMHFDTRE